MTRLDVHELGRRTGAEEVNEDSTEVVFRFTGEARFKFLPGLGDKTDTSAEGPVAFNHRREKVRQRRERALGFRSLVA